MSGASSNRRTPIVPEIEREMWRYRLFEHFCSRSRVENLILQDLRPLWNAAIAEVEGNDIQKRVRSFDQLGSVRRLERLKSPLFPYVQAIELAVSATLRLKFEGRPARWGCIHLHARVEPLAGGGYTDEGKAAGLVPPDPGETPPPLRPGDKRSAGFSAMTSQQQINVNPAGARISVVQPTGEPVVWVPAKEFMRFDEWEELRRAAYTAIDRQIEWFRTSFEDWYPTRQNPSTRTRWDEDARELVSHLLDHAPAPHGARRDRLRRFASSVGVDFPAD